MKLVYLANPLGFSPLFQSGLEKVMQAIPNTYEIYEPFRGAEDLGIKIVEIESDKQISIVKARAELDAINLKIGERNKDMIKKCDLMVAILDGLPEDTGVASEIGFASALGKKIYGLRMDFRYCGDNLAAKINLQIEYFIRSSGGKIISDLKELNEILVIE